MKHNELMHGQDYDGRDLTGWILTEKLDGCRAYWDGSALFTRSGIRIAAPDWFVSRLPLGFALDGEIYCGRDGFQAASEAVRLGRFSPKTRFVVFDAPMAGDILARLRRAQSMLRLSDSDSHVSHVTKVRIAASTSDAVGMAEVIWQSGGEGVMARHPQNAYRAGRTSELLKLTFEADGTPKFIEPPFNQTGRAEPTKRGAQNQ